MNHLGKNSSKALLKNMNKEIEIPEGYKARIDGNKVIIELKESEDERIRRAIIELFKEFPSDSPIYEGSVYTMKDALAYLEKQKDSEFTHHEVNESLQDAVTHQMEDDGDVDDFVRRGIDDIALKYAELGARWQKEQKHAECNKESKDKPILTILIDALKGNAQLEWALKKAGVDVKRLVTYIEEQKPVARENDFVSKPIEWSDNFEENVRNLLHDKRTWHSEDGSISSTVFIDDKTLKDIICGIWFYVGKEALKYPNKELNVTEWSEDHREEDLRTRFAFYTYKDEDDVLYLSNVFVEETSRNKGFGTKILAAAEKVAETLGAINIRLKVKQNSPANAWYRKNGYGYLTFEGDYDWLEKTLEYLKPSKKEWSEEDKLHLNNAMLAAEKEWGSESCTLKWLKALSLDFKKRNEDVEKLCSNKWSEEDENKLNHIFEIVHIASGRDVSIDEKEELESFLKSLPERFNLQPNNQCSREVDRKYDEILEWYKKERCGSLF